MRGYVTVDEYLYGTKEIRKGMTLVINEYSISENGHFDEAHKAGATEMPARLRYMTMTYQKKDRSYLRYRLEDELLKLAGCNDSIGTCIDENNGDYFVYRFCKRDSKTFNAYMALGFEEVPYGIMKKEGL